MSAEQRNVPAVVETVVPVTTSTLRSSLAVPSIIANAGDRTSRRFLDFFAASIENDNTTGQHARSLPGSSSTASASLPISSHSMWPPT
jgi:hypothetical protein